MKTKLLPILLSLIVAISHPGWAQLQRLPVKNVQVKPGLENYNSFLANRLLKLQNPGPGSGEKPFRRLEWYLESRLQQDGSYPAGARWNAFLEARANRSLMKTSAMMTANWTAIGPNNFAGRMLDIAFDPNNANVIWAGAASGGIWRSANGGSTWTPLDDQLPTLAIGCIATHPTNSNIIYIGTGEGSFNIDAVEGVGVLKSTDGGATWAQTGLSFLLSQGEAVNEMVIDPSNPNVLIAATRDGIYRTADAGTTWTRTLGTTSGWDGKEVVMDPSNSNNVYVALGYPWGNANNGIYKSTDNGVTWTKLTTGLPASASTGRVSLAISASSPNTLYAGIANTINSGSSLLGIYRTTDGGNTWTTQSTSPNHYNGQGWYNNVIAVDPANASIVYSGGTDIYKSTNAGVTWSTITNGIHVDFHAIAFNGSTVYVGCDGGVYKSTTGGSSWTSINSGLTTFQFYKMGSDFNNGNRAMGGTQDNGTKEYSGTTTWTTRLGGDGGEVVFDYSNSNIIYGEYQNGSHQKSTNGGASWFSINTGLPSGPWVTPVEMDPVNPSVLYTIGNSNLYKTSNGGTSWSLLFDAAETLDKDIQVAPSNNQTIYAAGAGTIYLSTNGGTSFAKISTGLAATSLTTMAAHPSQPQTLYVANGGWSATSHVYKTTNGGSTWQNVTSNLPNVPCNTIVIDPVHPEMVYAGTDLGVYVSENEGATWSGWNTGLPNVVIDELDIQATARTIRAATHGRGMYQTPMIEPNPGTPAISINDVTVTEGNTGTVNATFSATLSTASAQTVTVDYATANGTATAGSDYVAGSGTLTFATGITSQTFSVTVNGDVLDETNENFFVNLSAAVNATMADNQGQGTITDDDDSTPALAINDVAVTEGNTGTVSATFTVTLSAASSQTVTVNYATANGTATAGSDYVAGSGTVTFAPGIIAQSISVAVNGDVLDETNETFFVNLSAAVNATMADNQGQCTINDNEATPSLAINNVTVTEGNTGTANATFTVTLAAASGQTVTVNYATANGTATAGSDYVANSGTVTFAAGITSQSIAVAVNGDVLDETNETFFVNLSAAVNATMADNQGQGTINDNDSTPSLAINNVAVTEGNIPQGGINATFTVTLSAASGQTVTVNYATANGTATAGSDYVAKSGTVTFAAGTTSQPIAVTVNGDVTVEANETFFVNLSSAANATIADNQGQGTINNDDAPPVNLALNKPATALSTSGSNAPARAVDGSTSTYWRSGSVSTTTTMWWRVDLGASLSFNRVVINWRSSYYATNYQIQVSSDEVAYSTVYTDNVGNGGTDEVTFTATAARYVRIYMTRNNSGSERINEVEVYAASSAALVKAADDVTVAAIIPDEITLAQNYPNPFNPTTTLSYSLPQATNVVLNVINLNGQIVATLANGYHERGVYQVTFEASNLPSGVYFSVLKAGEVTQVRRMLQMK